MEKEKKKSDGDSDSDSSRRKRKRIKKVNVEKGRRASKEHKKTTKGPQKTEVSEEEIQKEIRETLLD